jgi:hypothetical protein
VRGPGAPNGTVERKLTEPVPLARRLFLLGFDRDSKATARLSGASSGSIVRADPAGGAAPVADRAVNVAAAGRRDPPNTQTA